MHVQSTLRESLQEKLRGGDDSNNYPCQVISLAGQIEFTARCEEALRSSRLIALQEDLRLKLLNFTESRGPDRRFMLTSGKALVLDLIHSMDVVDHLLQENASQPTDWTWSRQVLRMPTRT